MLKHLLNYSIAKHRLTRENEKLQEFFDIVHSIAAASRIKDMAEADVKLTWIGIRISLLGVQAKSGQAITSYKVAQQMHLNARTCWCIKWGVTPPKNVLKKLVDCVPVEDNDFQFVMK